MRLGCGPRHQRRSRNTTSTTAIVNSEIAMTNIIVNSPLVAAVRAGALAELDATGGAAVGGSGKVAFAVTLVLAMFVLTGEGVGGVGFAWGVATFVSAAWIAPGASSAGGGMFVATTGAGAGVGIADAAARWLADDGATGLGAKSAPDKMIWTFVLGTTGAGSTGGETATTGGVLVTGGGKGSAV